jgi:hypothetical protein
MTTISEVNELQNQIVLSKLAETVESADYRGKKVVILQGLPLPLKAFNMFFLGILRGETRTVYEGEVPSIREFWEEIEFKFTPIEKKKPVKLGWLSNNWSPSPEYLEKLPDARLIDTVLETINNAAKSMGNPDPSAKYIDYKALGERIYELVY